MFSSTHTLMAVVLSFVVVELEQSDCNLREGRLSQPHGAVHMVDRGPLQPDP